MKEFSRQMLPVGGHFFVLLPNTGAKPAIHYDVSDSTSVPKFSSSDLLPRNCCDSYDFGVRHTLVPE